MDALAKRHFSKIVLALIAACAWFQAVGFSHLLAAELSWPSAPTRRQGSVIHVSSEPLHETSAAPILARNAFDSITGPLDDRGREVPALPALPPADDPYADPICGSLRTTFIASSEDEAWSFAVLAQASASAELYRRGDAVPGAGTVVHIAWDRVWLQDGSGRCQVELHGKDPPVSKPGPITPSKSGGSNLPPEIASKIRRVSETQLVVDRSVIDLVLERQAELMKSARIAPIKRDGAAVGVRMQRIGPGSLLDTLGLKRGDVVRSINGLTLAEPEKALQAYAALRTTDRLQVSLERGGKPVTIDIRIE